MKNPEILETVLPRRETLFELMSRKISQMIEAGVWKTGDMLPNEAELAQRFKVSQGTVRRALKILTDQGILVRHQGRGTFVARFDSNPSGILARYVRMRPDDKAPNLPIRTILRMFEIEDPSDEVAGILRLLPGEKVIHIRRVHYTDRGPVSFDEHFLNAALFQKLTAENIVRHEELLLYAFYQNVCGVTIQRCKSTAKAEVLSEARCRQYGFEWPTAVICERRVAFALGDHPVEFRIEEYVTLDYHLALE